MDRRIIAHLRLPSEAKLPLFGSGCCVVAPDDAIRAELDGWRDVRTLEVDLTRRSVAVELGPDAAPPGTLVEALHALGIDATAAAADTKEDVRA
jgi:hypothetical protein